IALKRVGEGLLVDDLTSGDVDEHAPAFIAAKRSLSKRRVVSGVHWQQITTKSLSGKNRSRSPAPPSSLNPGGRGRPGCGWGRGAGDERPQGGGGGELPETEPHPAGPHAARRFPSQ